MTRTFKSATAVVSACLLAGLIAFWVLSAAIHRDLTVAGVPVQADNSSGATNTAMASEQSPLPGWVFRLSASAKDDPEAGRMLQADVQFEGTVPSCATGSDRGGQALGVDGTGGAASASREALVCLPGCIGQVPPAPRVWTGPGQLEVSAFQEEFDRATQDYGPQGRAAIVDWQCGSVAGRVTAAAMVALACDAEACGDTQKANASVHLATEQGRSLGPAKAFFALRSIAGLSVVGAVELR